MFSSTFPNPFFAWEGEAPAEPLRRKLGRSLALPIFTNDLLVQKRGDLGGGTETARSLQEVLPTHSENFDGTFPQVLLYSAQSLAHSILARFIAESPYRVAIGGKQQTVPSAVAV